MKLFDKWFRKQVEKVVGRKRQPNNFFHYIYDVFVTEDWKNKEQKTLWEEFQASSENTDKRIQMLYEYLGVKEQTIKEETKLVKIKKSKKQ